MDRLTPARALPAPVTRPRNAVLVVLLGLAAIGWVVFLRQADDPMEMERAMGPELTMGGSWPLFLSMWAAMMVAMMFPAAAPMIVIYGRMRRSDPVSVSLFTGSYIALWFAFGSIAYLLGAAVEAGASRSAWMAIHWGRVGGGLLMLAGVYQLSPLKNVCLRQCRTPIGFVMTHWQDGRGGAVRMGLEHGLYCMGCCWLLFLILVPLGVTNVAAMVAVALVVFAETALPGGRGLGLVAAVGLFALGCAAVLDPSFLPTVAG